MGIISDAAARLEGADHPPVVSALDLDDNPGAWTLRDLFLTAAGADRRAGTIAYFEHRELTDALRGCFAVLTDTLKQDAVVWAAAKGRRHADVAELLGRCTADVDPPTTLRRRPGSDPSVIRTCRIPYVPLAAAVHVMDVTGATIEEVVDEHQLVSADPWVMLERLDPRIADHTPTVDVRTHAEALRLWLQGQQPDTFSPGPFLARIAATHPGLHAQDLADAADDPGPLAALL